MNAGDIAAEIREHFERLGGPSATSEIYSESAVLEFAHTGERLVGRANIDAARRAYPGRPLRFEVHRVMCTEDFAVVELTLRFDGEEPHRVACVLDLCDGQIVGERRYIAEPAEPAPYRARWVDAP